MARASSGRWLAIIGIGEDGLDGLSPAARRALEAAEIVYGGGRHLALAAPAIKGEARAWPKPFETALPTIAALAGREVAVLASGDPFWFGAGASLAAHVPAAKMRVFPAPSAFSLAAARLGWPLQAVSTLSLHGRDFAALDAHLVPGARLIVLSWDETTPARIAEALDARGFGAAHLHVLERLGGPHERMRSAAAKDFALAEIHALNVVAIELPPGPPRVLLPGLADAAFEHDGQITRRDLRVLALAALAPRQGDRLWDIGGGAGSISIEWLRCDASLGATLIERDPARAARIRRNADRLGVSRLEIVNDAAPAALAGLAAPDAIFLGGGLSAPGMVDAAWAALKRGGRIVAHAVTVEGEAALFAAFSRFGGGLSRIALASAEPVGRYSGFKPAMPVTQWSATKP